MNGQSTIHCEPSADRVSRIVAPMADAHVRLASAAASWSTKVRETTRHNRKLLIMVRSRRWARQLMRPRRRKGSDDEVFDAAQPAMKQHGPHELTLADIAAEAGVTPGLLVQRFGGKRELLLALSAGFARSAPTVFEGLRAAHHEPLATVRAYAACMADLASTPDALSRNLAYLQIDLTDEAFRSHLLTNARATRREIESLLRSAIVAGELQEDVDPRHLVGPLRRSSAVH